MSYKHNYQRALPSEGCVKPVVLKVGHKAPPGGHTEFLRDNRRMMEKYIGISSTLTGPKG